MPEDLERRFPAHKCGLHLTHNDYKDNYETINQVFAEDSQGYYSDMTPEDKAECIRTDSLWTLHWYPDTPVGFFVVHGPTLERVLELANK
jgi:hypothetical protein